MGWASVVEHLTRDQLTWDELMKGSVLDRFGLEEYRKIREQVVYDPSAANGLRWLHTKSGRRSAEIGKDFWIDGINYRATWVVLILNDCWPEEGQNVAKRIDPSGSWSDVANLEWGVHGESRRQSAEQRRLALIHSVLGDAAPVFDERRRLAAPCRRGHLWNDYPLGLQIKQGQDWKCEQCAKEHNQAPDRKRQVKSWYERNKEDQRQKARERMAALREDPSYRKLMAERTKACRVRRWSTVGRESRLKGVQGLMMPPGRALTGPEAGVVRQQKAIQWTGRCWSRWWRPPCRWRKPSKAPASRQRWRSWWKHNSATTGGTIRRIMRRLIA